MSERHLIKQPFDSADEVESAFYQAITNVDIDQLMSLWSDDEDIVCIHPGAPRLIGHEAIRSAWEALFEQGSFRVVSHQLHKTQNVMMAIHSVIEEIIPEGELSKDWNADIHIIASNVYVKTPQGWRMVLHHASIAAGDFPVQINMDRLH